MGLNAFTLMITFEHLYQMPEDVTSLHSRAYGSGRPRTSGLDAPGLLSDRPHSGSFPRPAHPLSRKCVLQLPSLNCVTLSGAPLAFFNLLPAVHMPSI